MKIVQLGAATGNDHVTELVKNKDLDFLYLVEANQLNIPLLKECYKNTNNHFIDNLAIVSKKETDTIKLYYSTLDSNNSYQISSINKEHVSHYYPQNENLKFFEISCCTLEEYLNLNNIKKLDYLFIDIESLDADVILDLDLDKYDIKNIQIEWLHIGIKENLILDKFKKHNYIMEIGLDKDKFDRIFIKNKI
jgi:FkbM family methyltransferase